jgi:diketogulonate reductase-like aldo/keto reductase
MSAFVKAKQLPSGHSIPAVALGVYQSEPGTETYDAVLAALKLGYRHVDTATVYRNESDVGKAIRDAGIPRQEVFVTSKVVVPHNRWSYDEVVEAVRLSNRKLGLEYIDLYLLHAPFDGATRADAWRHAPRLRQLLQVRRAEVGHADVAHDPLRLHVLEGKENLEAAKLELTDEQMERLNSLDQYFVTAWDPIKQHAV